MFLSAETGVYQIWFIAECNCWFSESIYIRRAVSQFSDRPHTHSYREIGPVVHPRSFDLKICSGRAFDLPRAQQQLPFNVETFHEGDISGLRAVSQFWSTYAASMPHRGPIPKLSSWCWLTQVAFLLRDC